MACLVPVDDDGTVAPQTRAAQSEVSCQLKQGCGMGHRLSSEVTVRTGISKFASTARHRLKTAGRLQERSSRQPTFVHLNRGSRTGPIGTAKMQVNDSVDLGGHNSNRSTVVAGPMIDLDGG